MPRSSFPGARVRSRGRFLLLAGFAALAALAGCGGGGGGEADVPVNSKIVPCSFSYSLTAAPQAAGPDPLLGFQWHLQQIRAPQAWLTTRGKGVRVAVVDDAVEVVHNDLRPNLVEGASYSYRPGNRGSPWPLPCFDDDDHGTAVAGIVLARDRNGIGGAGVAPEASLVAFDALSTSRSADIADALRRGADVNAIFQNSWGAPDTGALNAAGTVFETAIEEGLRLGRGGLGSIFVFPAGNGGANLDAYGPSFRDNANYDGYVNKLGINTVCAVEEDGQAPFYAEPGANVLLCAPGSGSRGRDITTTGLQNGYRTDFAGTSASTPIVSGVAALMLAANPRLSWRDVRWILASTAAKTDPLHPSWKPAPGLGREFSHIYGYGVVDAQAAVSAAQTWVSVGGSSRMLTCEYVRTPGLALRGPAAVGAAPQPQADGITVPAAGSNGCPIKQVEFVELRFLATGVDSGALRIHLGSPAGTTSELAEQRTCGTKTLLMPCGDYNEFADEGGWRFGSIRHLGEPALGQWTLTVTNLDSGSVGTLARWSIRLHGR